MAFRHPPDDDTPVAEQFGSYARSAGLVLIYGAIVALLLGFALGSLSVWNQYEQARQALGTTKDTSEPPSCSSRRGC